jgi:hypothetical protein
MVKLLRKLVMWLSISAGFSQARLMKSNWLILLYIASDVLQISSITFLVGIWWGRFIYEHLNNFN